MKLAISGPGRSGTSLLVSILDGWGFKTPINKHNWHDSASAGGESHLGSNSEFEVDKDPWAYQYLDKLSDEQISEYSVLIVPIRDIISASRSRLIIDRASRPDGGGQQYWRWNDWASAPGGVVYPTNQESQEQTLSSSLWRLLEVASSRGMKIEILNFPKFATDFEYLWSHISPYLDERITKTKAQEIFNSIVKPSKIRSLDQEPAEMTLQEAIGLLTLKSNSLDSLKSEAQLLRIELQRSAIELQKVQNSISWRITLPIRKLKAILSNLGHKTSN